MTRATQTEVVTAEPDTSSAVETLNLIGIDALKTQICEYLLQSKIFLPAAQASSIIYKELLSNIDLQLERLESPSVEDALSRYKRRFDQALFRLKQSGEVLNPNWGQYALPEAASPSDSTGKALESMSDTKAFLLQFVADSDRSEPDGSPGPGTYWRDAMDAYAVNHEFDQNDQLDDKEFAGKLENRIRNALAGLVADELLEPRSKRASFGIRRTTHPEPSQITESEESEVPTTHEQLVLPGNAELKEHVRGLLSERAMAQEDIIAEVRNLVFGANPPANEPTNKNHAPTLNVRIRTALHGLRNSGAVVAKDDGRFDLADNLVDITQDDYIQAVETILDNLPSDTSKISFAELYVQAGKHITDVLKNRLPADPILIAYQKAAQDELLARYRLIQGSQKELDISQTILQYQAKEKSERAFNALKQWQAFSTSMGKEVVGRLDAGSDELLKGYQAAGPFGIPRNPEAANGERLERLLTGNEFIVLGQQGVGKSAILRHLLDRYGRKEPADENTTQDPNEPVVTNVEVSSIMGALPEGTAQQLSTEFEWRARFYLHYAEELLDSAKKHRPKGSLLFSKARRKYSRAYFGLWRNVNNFRQRGLWGFAWNSGKSIRTLGITPLGEIQFDPGPGAAHGGHGISRKLEVSAARLRAASSSDVPPIVTVVDRLDHVWSDSGSLKRELAGMVLAAMAISDERTVSAPNDRPTSAGGQSVPSPFKVVLLMRNDVFNVIKREVLGESRIKLSGRTIEVTWDEPMLEELLRLRMDYALEEERSDDAIYGALFGDETARKSLIHNSSNVPRNILAAVGNIITLAKDLKIAETEDPEKMLSDLVNDALRRMAENAQESVIANSFMSSMSVETLLAGLRNTDSLSGSSKSLHELADLAGALVPQNERTNQWKVDAARDLYRAGVIGYERTNALATAQISDIATPNEDTTVVFSFDPDAPFEPPLTLNTRVRVHPSMVLALWPNEQD